MQIFYALGTFAFWIGFGVAFRALSLMIKQFFKRGEGLISLKIAKLIAVFLFMGCLCLVTPMDAGRPFKSGWNLPLVWFTMPGIAWLSLAFLVFSAVQLTLGYLGMRPEEKWPRYRSFVYSFIASSVLYFIHKTSGMKIQILRGFITLNPFTALAVAFCLIAVLFFVQWIGQQKRAKHFSKVFTTHAMLIIGSIVFALPFVWLVVTSLSDVQASHKIGMCFNNYKEALEFLPSETRYGLSYLKNTVILVVMTVCGTLTSSAIVAYAFSRLRFPGKKTLFVVLLSTMMLPTAVTLLPTFLVFRTLGWIDTLYPLWVPAFFGSAFNIFLLRQFFLTIPLELEDAAKIDGCSYLRTFWSIMLPQIKPGLAVVAVWTLMGAWNNFLGPLVYLNSPEKMPLSYALQLFLGDHGNEPNLMMAFAAMATLPVLALFFLAQRYFIEGTTISGFGGR